MVLRSAALVVLAVVVSITLHAQAKSPVEGVWKVAEVQVTGGANPTTLTSPQPGFYIFTRGYYSITTVNGDKPRPVIPALQGAPTDAQKVALFEHWNPFTSNAGTYTIQGTTLMTKPLVAKNQGVMEGAGQTREFKLEGNTLWLIAKPPTGQTGPETRTKLTRVE